MKFTNSVDKRVKNDVIQLANASGIAVYNNPSGDKALENVMKKVKKDPTSLNSSGIQGSSNTLGPVKL